MLRCNLTTDMSAYSSPARNYRFSSLVAFFFIARCSAESGCAMVSRTSVCLSVCDIGCSLVI